MNEKNSVFIGLDKPMGHFPVIPHTLGFLRVLGMTARRDEPL